MEKEEEAQGKGPEGTRARPGDSGWAQPPLPLPVEQQAGQEVVSSCSPAMSSSTLSWKQRFLEGKGVIQVAQGKQRPSWARPWPTVAAWGLAESFLCK